MRMIVRGRACGLRRRLRIRFLDVPRRRCHESLAASRAAKEELIPVERVPIRRFGGNRHAAHRIDGLAIRWRFWPAVPMMGSLVQG